MGARDAARKRRVVFEVSKRFCGRIIKSSIDNVPRLLVQNRSATTIQRWLRCVRATRLARHALLQADRAARERLGSAAARKIQWSYRSHRHAKQQRELSATAISSIVRRRLAVLQLESIRRERHQARQCSMAVAIQCFARVSAAKNRLSRKKEEARIIKKAAGVLQSFFGRILYRQAERRNAENINATMIQKQVLGHTNRIKYVRRRSAAICAQRFIRGHQARRIFLTYTRPDMPESTMISCDESNEEKLSRLSLPKSPDDLADSACDGANTLDTAPSDVETGDRLNCCARILQKWYRDECKIRRAALLVTRVARKFLAVKKASELEAEREVEVEKKQAATRIQACVRMRQVETEVRARCRELLDFAMREIQREFDDSWSYLHKVKAAEPRKIESKVTVIPRKWLSTIPECAHPPFEFVTQE